MKSRLLNLLSNSSVFIYVKEKVLDLLLLPSQIRIFMIHGLTTYMVCIKKIRKIIFLTSIVFLIQSCDNLNKEAFEEFMKKYPAYDLDDFSIIQKYKPGYNIQFDLYNADSSKTLSFAYFPDITTYLKSTYFFSYQERDVYKDSCIV